MKIKNLILKNHEDGNIIVNDKEIKLHNYEGKLDMFGDVELIGNLDDFSRKSKNEILNIADEWLEYFKKSMSILKKEYEKYPRKNHQFVISVSKSEVQCIPTYSINNVIQEFDKYSNRYVVSGASIELPEDYKDVFLYLTVSALKYALEDSKKLYNVIDAKNLKEKGFLNLDIAGDYKFKIQETDVYNLDNVPELKEYVYMTFTKYRLDCGDIIDVLRDKVISHNYSSIIANSMDYNRAQIEYLESMVEPEKTNIK